MDKAPEDTPTDTMRLKDAEETKLNRHQRRREAAMNKASLKEHEAINKANQQMVDRKNKMEGFKGMLNIYTCNCCFGHIVTKDVDLGVTPFMIGCKVSEDCKGTMKSSMYRVFDQTMKHDFEWYRPEHPTDEMSQWERDHHQKGGLFLRRAR